jgi:hypothetical protein
MKLRLLAVVGIVGALVAVTGCRPIAERVAGPGSALRFSAPFDSPGDFFDRFDYGYSGPNPWDWGNGSGAGAITHFQADHDMSCGGPDTSRDVAFGGDRQKLDFSQLFWYCAPKGPASGHLMTGVDTVSYNVAWFSPKATFTNLSKVCWDINETELSHRKWTQIVFVGAADAVRYPSNRGTGGFDLGYTSPDNRDPNGPNSGLFPQGGTLAGFESANGAVSYFQSDAWTTKDAGERIVGVTDKATRYRHCLENQPNNVIRFTQDTPNGTRAIDLVGQLPGDARRVVFEDDNYNAPKDAAYNPDFLTWHWDNIEIEAGQITAT